MCPNNAIKCHFGVQLAAKRSAQFVGHGLDAHKIQCDRDQFSDISFALSYKNLQISTKYTGNTHSFLR